MERRVINPWTWQEQYGFVHANEVSGEQHVLYCAGITAVDDEGQPVHAGDMKAQGLHALDNLQTVLAAADFSLADVVRLNFYVTDTDAFFEASPALNERLAAHNCRYAGTLLRVAGLARPENLIEIEATAAR